MMFRTLVALAMLSLVGGTPIVCATEGPPCSPSEGAQSVSSGRRRGPVDRYGRLARGDTAGWPDLPNSKFYRFHEYLELYVSTTTPQYKVQPRTLEWGCANQVIGFGGQVYDIGSCLALVFIYRCKPCESAGQNEMVGKLLAEGWEPVGCAGYFDLDKNVDSHDHRFMMFYQEFEPTQTSTSTLSLNVEQETEFMFWGQIHKGSTMCAHQPDDAACTAHSADDCFWDSGTSSCRPVMCPKRKHQGPGFPECGRCVHDEDNLLQ